MTSLWKIFTFMVVMSTVINDSLSKPQLQADRKKTIRKADQDNDKDEIGSDENSSDNDVKYLFNVKDDKSSRESRPTEDDNPKRHGPLKKISEILENHKKEKYGNVHKNRKYDSLENNKYSNTNENMIVSKGDTLEDIGSKSMIRADSFIEDEARKVRISNEIQRSVPQSIEEDDAKNVKECKDKMGSEKCKMLKKRGWCTNRRFAERTIKACMKTCTRCERRLPISQPPPRKITVPGIVRGIICDPACKPRERCVPSKGGLPSRCVPDLYPIPRIEKAKIPVDGAWGPWSAFGKCSKTSITCGGGIQLRRRACINPAPMYGGKTCLGPASQTSRCNIKICGKPEMRLDRPVKQKKTSVPDIRLAHPSCTTDSECITLLGNDGRCGPKGKCYLAKPCTHDRDCSREYICRSPNAIQLGHARAQFLRKIKTEKIAVSDTNLRTSSSNEESLNRVRRKRKVSEEIKVTAEENDFDIKNDDTEDYPIMDRAVQEDNGSMRDELDDFRGPDDDSLFLETSSEPQASSKERDIIFNDDDEDDIVASKSNRVDSAGGISDKSISDLISDMQPDLTDSVSVGAKEANKHEANTKNEEESPNSSEIKDTSENEKPSVKLLQPIRKAPKRYPTSVKDLQPIRKAPKPQTAVIDKVCVRRSAIVQQNRGYKRKGVSENCGKRAIEILENMVIKDERVRSAAFSLLKRIFSQPTAANMGKPGVARPLPYFPKRKPLPNNIGRRRNVEHINKGK